MTVTTVVYNNVGSHLAAGEDVLLMYRAAQWTAFAFGVLGAFLLSFKNYGYNFLPATVIGIICFRGVGVVGFREPKTSSSSMEQGSPVETDEIQEKNS